MSSFITSFADIESKEIQWLWNPYIALEKLTLAYGTEEADMTDFMLRFTAALSTGGTGEPPCSILYFDSEMNAGWIKSKLQAYKADLTTISCLLDTGLAALLKAKDEINELNKKITKIDDERVAIFKELDYKNKMILAYNVELNKSILNAINVVIDEARDNINRRNAELVDGLEKSIERSKQEVNEKNKAIAYDIQATVEDMNEQIRNTSTLKMVLNKRKINLRVPVDDLLKPFEFDFDTEKLLAGQALELDASEILKEVMPKLPEPFSKYIDTLDEEDIPETIDISSKKED